MRAKIIKRLVIFKRRCRKERLPVQQRPQLWHPWIIQLRRRLQLTPRCWQARRHRHARHKLRVLARKRRQLPQHSQQRSVAALGAQTLHAGQHVPLEKLRPSQLAHSQRPGQHSGLALAVHHQELAAQQGGVNAVGRHQPCAAAQAHPLASMRLKHGQLVQQLQLGVAHSHGPAEPPPLQQEPPQLSQLRSWSSLQCPHRVLCTVLRRCAHRPKHARRRRLLHVCPRHALRQPFAMVQQPTPSSLQHCCQVLTPPLPSKHAPSPLQPAQVASPCRQQRPPLERLQILAPPQPPPQLREVHLCWLPTLSCTPAYLRLPCPPRRQQHPQ
mmetsp:Transcript_2273/g.8002  ORF Transcript_2273/g.8002 Transcript_2273/m.8002 type:complete len:327 (+) Transcript_2273:3456-4436(+)